MRKCPGVKSSIPSDASGKGVNGLELRQASICVSTVVISSKVNFVTPTTFFRCFLKLFTAASHKPPKCGACLGVNFHLMLKVVQKSEGSFCESFCLKNDFNSPSSLAAPTKLVPWSIHITDGFPLLAINRRRVAMNEAVVKSDTYSKCTALVAKHTKTATYDFRMEGLRMGPDFVRMGPVYAVED